jgi:hypothetical protein
MDSLIKNMLSMGARKSSGSCPDENLMAAYLEGSLTSSEKSEFESHVSDCASCREILAVSIRLQPQESSRLQATPVTSKRTLFRFSIPIPVLGVLLIAAVLAGVLFRHTSRQSINAPKEQVAENRPAVQQPADLRETAPQPMEAAPAVQPSRQRAKEMTRIGPQSNLAASTTSGVDEAPAEKQERMAEGTVADKKGGFEEKAKAVLADRDWAANAPEAVPAAAAPLPPPPVKATAQALKAAQPAVVPESVGRASEMKQPVQAERAASQEANIYTEAVVQKTPSRPKIYAAQNRIAASNYATTSVVASLKEALDALAVPANLQAAESMRNGDRTFYKNSGIWIDQQCIEHASADIIEIKPGAPEYKALSKQYSNIRTIVPAAIYWEGKIYILR